MKDIVGSRNAPYINGLINDYGYGANYFAQTHPSLPNYYPILGGTDFGFNYNCELDCFDAPNLADNIEGAGKGVGRLRAVHARSMFHAVRGSLLPPANSLFSPSRHSLQHRSLPGARASAAADGHGSRLARHHPELRVDRCGRKPQHGRPRQPRVLLSLLTNHQYNIKAGDHFLADTLPAILNSPAFRTQRSAIFFTLDEDYNNLSLGIGNEGNHVR